MVLGGGRGVHLVYVIMTNGVHKTICDSPLIFVKMKNISHVYDKNSPRSRNIVNIRSVSVY